MKVKLLVSASAMMLAAQLWAQDTPAYYIAGRDSTCQIFIYSPGEKAGLHVAYYTEGEQWKEVGQLCSSDYGEWGSQKKMYNPFVLKANDGTWRAVWSVNNVSPCFAAAYSEDLITWRPQDYPIVKEKGISAPTIYQMDDGTFDIYLKTAQGKRYVKASQDFRTFEEDSLEAVADEILWQREKAIVGGKEYEGNLYEVPAVHLNYIIEWFKALAEDNRLNALALPKSASDLEKLLGRKVNDNIEATLHIDASKTKKISDKLMGIFFEDISRAADGGIWAELIQNGDFEYTSADKREWKAETAWEGVQVKTENALSTNNPHYTLLSDTPIYNIGWDGFALKQGATYNFSLYANNLDGKKKQLTIALVNKNNEVIAQAKLKIENTSWKQYQAQLIIKGKQEVSMEGIRLAIIPKGTTTIAVDMVSLMPQDTYKGHGLRKDLAEAIANIHPKFVRFPGGCMLHGQGLDNIYHWKESIGPLKDRKPAMNVWHYHQTRALGFYEYFQWCEDMGAEPLPVLAAGVPCQNSTLDANGLGGQQGGIPMKDMPKYIQDVLDLIEWANGDPATSKWAQMRAEAGHPAPFNLKMIGIGNEDIISTVFKERYLMICKAIKEKYPNIEVVGTVGPFHWPSADYIEGWKIAKDNRNIIDAVDEHYYEQPGWFVNHQDYYDEYDRSQAKVYLGEYASRGKDATDNALAEGIHLCNVERNADIVEMASYAPLLSKDGYSNWSPDMIYFTNSDVRLSESYKMQQMFSTHSGDTYISSTLSLPKDLQKYVGTSVVKDSKTGKTWLKVVNALPHSIKIQLTGMSQKSVEVEARKATVIEL